MRRGDLEIEVVRTDHEVPEPFEGGSASQANPLRVQRRPADRIFENRIIVVEVEPGSAVSGGNGGHGLAGSGKCWVFRHLHV
jgi:hypothetical protein